MITHEKDDFRAGRDVLGRKRSGARFLTVTDLGDVDINVYQETPRSRDFEAKSRDNGV